MASHRTVLSAARRAAGYTQEQLAAVLRVDRTTVIRWESGRQRPQPHLLPELGRTLRLTRDQLLAMFEGDGAAIAVRTVQREVVEAEDVNRRELLRLSGTTALLAFSASVALDTDRIAAVAGERTGPDPATLDELERLSGHLWRLFMAAGNKNRVLAPLRGQLELLYPLVRSSVRSAGRRMCALLADMFQLAGEISFDGNRYTEAIHYYTLAAGAAKEAAAPDVWACALTRHAFVAIYDQAFDQADAILDQAHTVARQGDPALATRYWVSAVRAEAAAGAGDFDGCLSELDEAERVRDGAAGNGGWLRFDGSRLAEQRGACFTRLGRYDRAERAIGDALREAVTRRRKGIVHADAAVLAAHSGDADRVVAHASDALVIARTTGSGVVGTKLSELRGHLGSLPSSASIRSLDAELVAIGRRNP